MSQRLRKTKISTYCYFFYICGPRSFSQLRFLPNTSIVRGIFSLVNTWDESYCALSILSADPDQKINGVLHSHCMSSSNQQELVQSRHQILYICQVMKVMISVWDLFSGKCESISIIEKLLDEDRRSKKEELLSCKIF